MLAADGGLVDRVERIEALALIPEQIEVPGRAVGRRFPRQEPMLEVLARRHYREYALHDLARSRAGSTGGLAARRRRLQPRRAPDPPGLHDRHAAELSDPGAAWRRRSDPTWPAGPRATTPSSTSTCTGRTHPRTPTRPVARWVRSAALPFAHDGRRLSVAVCAGLPVGYYAFRPDGSGGMVEDTLTRGVHPMVGRRLNL